jgi:hypothetical protein
VAKTLRGFWNAEKINAEAKKYKTRNEFCIGSPSAYLFARRNGLSDEACKHMGRPRASYKLSKKERFWQSVNKTDSCWVWTRFLNPDGYGQIKVREKNGAKTYRVHRYSLMLSGIKIPKEMFVDHICRNRACVRPEHLRVVTPKVNSLENSIGPLAINSKKTHCKRGHKFTKQNTRVMKTKYGTGRCCIVCHRSESIKHYNENKEAIRLKRKLKRV